MPAIILGKVNPVGLMVSRQHKTERVEDVVLVYMLLVDEQHVRRRRSVRLEMLVKAKTVSTFSITEVASFVYAQNHRLGEVIEPTEQMRRRHVMEIPRTDRILDRLEHRVFADALGTAKHEGVVDLLLGALHALR